MLPARFLLGTAAVALAAQLATAPAVAAAADPVTVIQRQTDVNPGETNPCSGAPGTIIDEEQDVVHLTTLANGALQITGHNTTAVTFIPDDPTGIRYSGHETYDFTAAGHGNTLTTTLTTQLRVRGTDGSFLAIRELAHVTATAAGITIAFDRPAMLCP